MMSRKGDLEYDSKKQSHEDGQDRPGPSPARLSSKKTWLKIALIPASVVATLLAAELVLRIAVPLRFRPDQDAPLFASKTYRLSANKDLVYEQQPDTDAFEYGIDYAINSYGFRDKPYRPATSHSKRVICVGDSLTYGWLVPLKDTYHKQLERLLNAENRDVEVLGMGVVGYNAVQEYHLVRDKVLRLNPDLVLLQIGPNDFERTVGIKTVATTGKLVLIPYHDFYIPYVLPKTKFSESLMRYSHLFKLLNLALNTFAVKRDPGYRPHEMYLLGQERSFRYLAKTIELLKQRKILVAVAIFPFQNHGGPYLYASLTQRIRRQLENSGVPELDLYGVLNPGSDKDLFIDGLHLTEKGNAAVAQELSGFIVPLLFAK
jgi:lysophospholipase L1-like esterase